ncbi:hypothetical protein OESDEN_08064 [Oesophagostomum dentatum]|uniref:Cadherin domain-containing protein n=1 Tax=Oesophagostomum dentatum TaxID=61180 RepID=A0A0B1T9M0_OESDE|nr:hypothetical protein OESDEN_08064 [Oesophagostomum dentatum]
MFTVDAATGVVRTAVRQYKEGQTYRVLVQAIDKTPTENSTKQESEVAKLEILAGDRPPQFLQQHYVVSLPEDSLVDYRRCSELNLIAHSTRIPFQCGRCSSSSISSDRRPQIEGRAHIFTLRIPWRTARRDLDVWHRSEKWRDSPAETSGLRRSVPNKAPQTHW